MRDKALDLGTVLTPNFAALAVSAWVTALEACLRVALLAASLAFTFWRWFRVAHKTTPTKRVVNVKQGTEFDEEES